MCYKSGGWLIMHHVVALIAERQGGTCTNRPFCRELCALCPRLDAKLLWSRGVSLKAASLFLRVRGKAVYILPSSEPTLAFLKPVNIFIFGKIIDLNLPIIRHQHYFIFSTGY
ncbi:hypothetical protein Hanom_Chr10g00926031 [Helianthus anomalus]